MAYNWRDCVGLALGRMLDDREAEALRRRFDSARARRAALGEAADDMSVAKAIGEDLAREQALAKRNILLNQIAYRALRDFDGRFGDKALAVKAMLGGINTPIEGGRLSIAAQHQAIFKEYLGGMLADLRKAGAEQAADLVKLMATRDMELPLRQELRGQASGNPQAKAIAAVIDKWFEAARLRENRAGSWIGKLEDYGGGQSHDARRVYRAAGKTPRNAGERAAAYEAWRDAIMPLLDKQRTLAELGDGEDLGGFLRQTWNAITADRWDTAAGGEFAGVHKYIGPANLGRRASEHRVIHFKSAEAAQAYNDRFGRGSLIEGVIGRLERGARNIALMENLGPNPEAMLDRWRRDLAKELQDEADPKAAQALGRRGIDNLMAEVTGASRAADNVELAHWASAIRALESMAKLGAATLSSFGDVATVAGELRYQGQGFLEAWGNALSGFLRGRRTGETRIAADLVGVGFEGIIGGIHARFHSTDAPLGQMTRLLQQMFRLNLLNWWTDTHKTTAGLVTARYFAHEAPMPWERLRPESQRLLSQYGIDGTGWDLLRRAGLQKGEDGTEFLVPAGIRALPADAFTELAARRLGDLEFSGGAAAEALAPRMLEDARDRLATAYQALLTDRADFAVPTPGAREAAMMNQGTERGTLLGETLRFVMQFKAFPVAMISRVLGRDLHGSGGGMGAVARLGETIATLTAMGYLSIAAKDLVRGKEPPDPTNLNSFYRAISQGGGLGIYGDFILGEHDRFGRSPAETLLGPAFGTAGDVVKIANKAIRGDFGAADSLRFAVSNAPFLNLFYARPVLDYFVLHPIYESLKPGYIRRLQRESEKRYGQSYWIY